MQIRGAVPQEAFAGELPQGVTCVGIPTSAGVLTAAFVDEAVAGIAPEAESALEVHEVPHAGEQLESVPALLVPGFTGSKDRRILRLPKALRIIAWLTLSAT